ncbi:MAG: ATP-binding cassette domain-containing protein [Pseudomonadota bacterium]
MIRVHNLSFAYAPERHIVFEHLNLHIEPLTWAAVIGPDGSGKTTLGKLVKGLLIPDAGSISITDTCARDVDSVGYLGGDPADLAVGMTVEEDVVFGMENMGLPRREIRDRLKDALMRTGLANMGKRLVHTLSGGEQQKLALAGVLAMRVKVLIIDEALGMLDRPVRRSIRSLLASLRRDPGLTIMEMASGVDDLYSADRVVFLSRGNIGFDGSASEFLSGLPGIRWSSMNGGLPALNAALHQKGLIPEDGVDAAGPVGILLNHINQLKH